MILMQMVKQEVSIKYRKIVKRRWLRRLLIETLLTKWHTANTLFIAQHKYKLQSELNLHIKQTAWSKPEFCHLLWREDLLQVQYYLY